MRDRHFVVVRMMTASVRQAAISLRPEKLFESNWKTCVVRPASKTSRQLERGGAWNIWFVIVSMPPVVMKIVSSPSCAIVETIVCGRATFEIPFH